MKSFHVRIRSVPKSDDKEWGVFFGPGLKDGPVNGWWFHSYGLAMAHRDMWASQ